MNRWARLLLPLLAAETTAAAVATGVWAWRRGLFGADDLRHPLLIGFLFVFPVLTWALVALAPRRLASDRPRLAADHRRHLQGALGFWFVVLAAAQGWLVYGYVHAGPPPLDRDSFARLVFILMGVAMAVRGNFFAKLSPPTGQDAPEPGAWTRASLRTGWGLTLIGAAMVASALFLPLRALIMLPFVVAPALMALGVAQRRTLRSRGAAS